MTGPEAAPTSPSRWRRGAATLFRVRSAGDALGVVGALVLLTGGWLVLEAHAPEQSGTLGWGVVTLGSLLLLQSVSSATPLGKFLVAGGAAVGGAALGINLWLFEPRGLDSLPAAGEWVTLLGALLSLASADFLRREAGKTYPWLARRASQLAQEPDVHRAALLFFIPWAIVGFAVLLILELGPEIAAKYAAIFIQYFFNPVGKEVALVCGIHSCPPLIPGPPLQAMQVAPFLVLIDAVTALFLAWNYRYVLRVPFLGDLLRWIETHGRKTVEKRAWIRRLAFFGVTLYAAGPFEGTGAIGGTIVGRTIGLDAARTWGAVVSGSIIRTTIITIAIVAGTAAFLSASERGLGLPLVALVSVLVAVVVAVVVWRRKRRKARAQPKSEPESG